MLIGIIYGDLSPNGKLLEPKDSGQYSRFLDNGKYVIIGRDPITIWLRIPSPLISEFTINFKTLDIFDLVKTFSLNIRLFGYEDKECSLKKEAKANSGQSGSIFIDYSKCQCDLYELFDDEEGRDMEGSYMPLKLWTNNIMYYFEQDGDQVEMYIDEEEAEKWNSPSQQPSHESSMKIPSKNGTELPLASAQTKESDCDNDLFLWLFILVIIIDIIL
uniref:Uncharacterized protein n=1 Tax=Panagrolaimus davidi TaxID=227884 RepID=A0A914QXJ0_9BILA